MLEGLLTPEELSALQTADELAPKLGISPATLMGWARVGRVPSVRYTRPIRFNEDAVKHALRQAPEPMLSMVDLEFMWSNLESQTNVYLITCAPVSAWDEVAARITSAGGDFLAISVIDNRGKIAISNRPVTPTPAGSPTAPSTTGVSCRHLRGGQKYGQKYTAGEQASALLQAQFHQDPSTCRLAVSAGWHPRRESKGST